MKNLQKIISILIITFICFTLCGCANVDYGIEIYANGIVCERFYTHLDESLLKTKGFTSSQVISEIKNVAITVVDPYIDDYVNKSVLTRTQSTQNGLNSYKTTVYFKTSVGAVPYTQAVIAFEIKNTSDEIEVSLSFYSAQVYYDFYGVTQEDIDKMAKEDVIDENFLFTKTTTTGKTAFDNIANSSITTHFIEYFTKNETEIFNLSNISFSYSYATYDSSLKSNCDYKDYNDGLTYHIWNVSSTNLDRTTIIYSVEIKPVYWYVFALGATVIFLLVLFIIYFINKTRKRKELLFS